MTCVGMAYLTGKPVYTMPKTRIWADRYLAPLSEQQREQLWTEICNRTVDWKQYRINAGLPTYCTFGK